jgi:hypothetical protein
MLTAAAAEGVVELVSAAAFGASASAVPAAAVVSTFCLICSVTRSQISCRMGSICRQQNNNTSATARIQNPCQDSNWYHFGFKAAPQATLTLWHHIFLCTI